MSIKGIAILYLFVWTIFLVVSVMNDGWGLEVNTWKWIVGCMVVLGVLINALLKMSKRK